MIKYKARWYCNPEIKKIEVERETDKQIISIDGRRENKETDYYFYGNTYQEARKWLLDKTLKNKSDAEKQIKNYQNKIEQANKDFALIYDFNEE